MPEFDPNKIPVLDDIIENGSTETAPEPDEEARQTDAFRHGQNEEENSRPESATPPDTGNPDLFADNSLPETEADTLPLSTDEPLDDILLFEDSDATLTHTDEHEEEPQSALIGYPAEEDTIPETTPADEPLPDSPEPQPPELQQPESSAPDQPDPMAALAPETESPAAEPAEAPATDSPDVDTINEAPPANMDALLKPLIDDIVHQLMPDLEQQLRFLVQQALEDHLPEELLHQLESRPVQAQQPDSD